MSTPTDLERLEQRLRAAADAVPAHPLATDAWVENQQRLARDARRRSTLIMATAAAVALVLALVGGAALVRGGLDGATPASGGGGDDPWAPKNYLGEPQVVEETTVDGVPMRHELVLTDTDGKGPNLCDQLHSADGSSGSGGCTARDPEADRAEVAFDWLSGSEGGGTHGVVAGVDERVRKVQVWMSNGDMVLADLRPTGWEGTRMFALTLQDANAPVPQRVVAYSDARGTVVQAVDLGDRFGDDWLCAGGRCGSAVTGVWPFLGSDGPSDVTVRLKAETAAIAVAATPDHTVQTDLTLQAGSLAAWQLEPTALVVVTGPEVAVVQVRSAGAVVGEGETESSQGSPWQVALLRDLPADIANGTALGSDIDLVALDATGHVVGRSDLTARSG